MNERLLSKSIKILLLLVLLVTVLVYAKPFLVPVVFAALFSTLLLPLSVRFESWGMTKGLAILASLLLFIALIAGIVSIMVWQVSDLSTNATKIEQRVNERIRELKDYVSETFGISPQRQDELLQSNEPTGGTMTATISGVLSSAGSFLTHMVLTLVYVFLFLYYRPHLEKFILMLAPPSGRKDIEVVMEQARGVAQKYIGSLALMVVCLWIMYSIGFSIVGVDNAVFFAVLCGLLEIVPFVGNLTGSILTVLAVVMQNGSTSMILGVIATYATVQFLQTYILEPLVVGKGVSINPLFTIAGIVAGELVWGIPGMILAIPMLGITKIICDHIEPLKPYGFLVGQEKKQRRGIIDRVKQWGK